MGYRGGKRDYIPGTKESRGRGCKVERWWGYRGVQLKLKKDSLMVCHHCHCITICVNDIIMFSI